MSDLSQLGDRLCSDDVRGRYMHKKTRGQEVLWVLLRPAAGQISILMEVALSANFGNGARLVAFIFSLLVSPCELFRAGREWPARVWLALLPPTFLKYNIWLHIRQG